ncbi:hypothetical protein AB0C10_16130 [Microbispora amethystogenes]|uniref:hypothetical protein n=1 Tax=Microbispora amethystogenes TaxID=1427754 RepID=UPI0033D8BA72
MKRPNPGRLPPAAQRTAAQRKLAEEARAYYEAIEGPRQAYLEAIKEPTARLHAAITAAAQPPTDVPGSDKKSLVTRADIVQILKDADPEGNGLSLRAVQKVVHDAEQTATI